MRFSVTFCALLLVTTTGIAQADSSKPVKTAGNNQADSSDNAITALDDLSRGSWANHYGFFLEKGEGGRGVAIARKTARENNIGPSTHPDRLGQIATHLKDKDIQLFVGTPSLEQSVMASRTFGDGRASVTYFNLDPITHKLLSATVCDYNRPCLTITKKSCDSIFPESDKVDQRLKKIQECGSLMGNLEKIHDPTAEKYNLAKMSGIRREMKLSPSKIIPHVFGSQIVGQKSDYMMEIETAYYTLARAVSFCRRAGSFERFVDPVKVLNSARTRPLPPGNLGSGGAAPEAN
jgi:hypothetical protein